NGWLDLSRDTPDENLTKVMPSIREAATSKRADSNCVFYAAPPGEEAAVVATLRSEADSEPLDDDALGRARDQLGHGGVFRTEDARLKTSTASGGRGSPGEPARTARRVSSST
ncbi:MAG TPA: hypothetical protein VIF62_25490, partial [Labilithrix sp.]